MLVFKKVFKVTNKKKFKLNIIKREVEYVDITWKQANTWRERGVKDNACYNCELGCRGELSKQHH